eukprot:1370499-Amphidinium_carterae.2
MHLRMHCLQMTSASVTNIWICSLTSATCAVSLSRNCVNDIALSDMSAIMLNSKSFFVLMLAIH